MTKPELLFEEGKLVKLRKCDNCLHFGMEERIRSNGMFYYRCNRCIKEADKKYHLRPLYKLYCLLTHKHSIYADKSIPCPICGCKAHVEIYGSWEFTEEGLAKCKRDINNKARPEIAMLECLNCGTQWNTKEYEQYLFSRCMK